MIKTLSIFAIFVISVVTAEINTFAKKPEIQTSGGLLRGDTAFCGIKCNYYRFRGIPYALPPVDNLRFRAPVPHPGWNGTLNALKHGKSCPSLWPLGTISLGEDCLTLNVYTKSLTGNKPVMVWIFGGGFFLGSGNDIIYGPDYLVDEEVIVVTINYRLAAFGFLSTGDNNAPGNYGLKDCVLALKWIQKNIEHFGGDPTRVTIFGESAGGAAVHYLILSPAARGLFSRAISQSGSALSPWAFQDDPQTSTHNLAKKLNISFTDNTDLIDKLRNVKVTDILLATPEWMNYPVPRGLLPFPFAPSQDPEEVEADEQFLPDTPLNIVRSGKFNHVPYITGFTSDEALAFIREVIIDPSVLKKFNKNPHLLIPKWWNIPFDSPEANEIIKKIRQFYFHGSNITYDMRYEYSQYNTDLMFVHSIDKTVSYHSKWQSPKNPVYMYKFNFVGALNLIKTILLLNEYPGASHADDIFYLFKVAKLTPPLLPNNSAVKTRQRMVRLWTNFAKYGNPTLGFDSIVDTHWSPVNGRQEYLSIDRKLTPGEFPTEERIEFWKNLEKQYSQQTI